MVGRAPKFTEPWRGWSHGTEMSEGVIYYSLGAHEHASDPDVGEDGSRAEAGVLLDQERNAQMPDKWRKADGWYSEFEPRRVCRRLFGLSHATIANSSICA